MPVSISGKSSDRFKQSLKSNILILDGAMGTMIQAAELSEADYQGERFKLWPSELFGNNDLLSLTKPELIKQIHREYFNAGADIVETNTFNSTSISMADYGMQDLVFEINQQSAKIACEVEMNLTPMRKIKINPAMWLVY